MADRPRFGPAGVPTIFKLMGVHLSDVPRLLREEELDAFEYEAVRWGQKPQMKQQDAEALGSEARKNDVMLSMHGSYYVNLGGKNDVVEASKRRLIACATAAHWMGAYVVVFHTGFYGRWDQSYVFKNCVQALKDVVQIMKSTGIKDVKLGPETMGKPSQVGSLPEILSICEQVEQTQLVIDWSHLHARHQGKFRKPQDFREIAENVEQRLGTEAARNMHCHFSKIQYTDKGEKRHHTLDEPRYGPDFQMLAEVIADFKLRPVIIAETEVQDVDAMRMKRIFNKTMDEMPNRSLF